MNQDDQRWEKMVPMLLHHSALSKEQKLEESTMKNQTLQDLRSLQGVWRKHSFLSFYTLMYYCDYCYIYNLSYDLLS